MRQNTQPACHKLDQIAVRRPQRAAEQAFGATQRPRYGLTLWDGRQRPPVFRDPSIWRARSPHRHLGARSADQTLCMPRRSSIQNDGRAWCILSFMPSLDEVKKGLLQILESNGYDVSGLTGDSQIPYGSAGTLAVGISEKWNFNIAGDELQGIGIGGSGQAVSLDQLANMIAD